MPPAITEAAHFIHGDAAADVVRRAGAPADRTHVRRDLLTVGPCDADPLRHRALRKAYWDTSDEQASDFADPAAIVAALPPTLPLVLWASPAWSDQLWLWWTLDALAGIAAAEHPLWLVEPRPARSPLASVGGASEEEASEAFAAARLVSDEQRQQGRALWHKYADASPLALDAARSAGATAFPHLAQSAEVHGWWFPRIVDGKLRLAELDELTLSTFAGSDWRTPRELRQSERGADVEERLFLPFGDRFFLRRLEDWARHGGLQRQARGGADPWSSVAYRTTAGGRAALADGIDAVSDAPTLFVGGCLVNDPTAPWRRRIDPGGWTLVR